MDQILLLLLLLAGGLLLILVEVCTPTFGLLGLAAAACLCGAVYVAFGLNPWLAFVLATVLIIGVPIYVVWAMRWLPKTAIGKTLFRIRETVAPGEGVPNSVENRSLLGATGEALSTLRPSGTARIGGRRMTVSAENGYIEAGTTIKVVKVDGMTPTVRPAEPVKTEAGQA